MNFLRCLVAFFVVAQSCEKLDLDEIDNLNNGKIDVIGHAGGGFQSLINPLPSNSFASIKKAVDALNVDGIEIDVKVSTDSIPILFHDDVLEMGSNCAGCPENYSGKDLMECRYKNYYGTLVGEDEKLISFQRMIDHFKGRAKLPHIYTSPKRPSVCTLNDPGSADKYANVIARIIKENNAYSWISFYDSDISVLEKIKAIDPDINLIFNAEDFEGAFQVCVANNYSGMVIEANHISKEQVKQAHQSNKRVTIWGVIYKKEIIEAIKKQPDALMTDNIQLTQEILRR